MNLKSFFDLEKVVFSKKELEAPCEDKPTDVIFIRKNNSYKEKPTDIIFNRNKL